MCESPRWASFASEFANADELLLLVVDANTPGLDKLAANVDGAVLVGIQKLEAAPNANILAKIPHPAVVPPPRIDIAPKREPWSYQHLGIGAAALLDALAAETLEVGLAFEGGSRAADDRRRKIQLAMDLGDLLTFHFGCSPYLVFCTRYASRCVLAPVGLMLRWI